MRLLDDLIALVALALAYLTVRALLLDVVRARETLRKTNGRVATLEAQLAARDVPPR